MFKAKTYDDGALALALDRLKYDLSSAEKYTVDGIEKTSDFETSDAARSAIYALDADNVTQDLKSVLKYAKSIEAGNGQVYVVGFCWGGSQSFRFATNAGDEIEAALVFYGTGPQEAEAYSAIEVPVFGFYGENMRIG